MRPVDLRRGDDRSVRPTRVELRNRLWQGIQTVSVITGLDAGVDAAALRATLRRLHAVDPTARVLCRLEGSPLRWTPVPADELDAWLHRLVTEAPGGTEGRRPTPEEQETIAAGLLPQPPDDRPFTVTVGDGYLGWQVNHVLGDGNYGLRSVVGGLLRATATGEVPTGLLASTDSTTRYPLAKATWNSLAREPKLATWKAALRRGLDQGGRPDQPSVPDDTTGLSLVARTGPVGTMATLRAWGAEHHPGVSVTLLLMSAARRALERHGAVHPSTDSVVMYDLRRYLPSSVDVVGNFSAALRLTDPSCRDPRQVAEQVNADVGLGLPLVSLMAASASEALSPLWSAVTRSGNGERTGGPVVLSHLGSMGFLRRLPWDTSAGPGQVLTCAAPSIPGGITVCTSEWGKALSVTLTYDSTFVARDKVVAAAEALVERPWSLLDEAGEAA
ncbi:conserved protein of unknown function [Modestobacter italicus]|uniref:Diacylglycerol O-acyltransferase n=1 Tax=Modestobacter italicus (strain DSM 44449 / CECT 9708 / BC 501) TaxID=2732864 RepID=I4ER56_MODI5|nr:hypothetical protein [Modestobacter marinus]CCH85869.1 conserved protein of unknown function [Modestobacter marinus]